ncbi:MAG: GerAB/ArcD/ProY family transporter [Christensenellales bacterium]
MKRLTTNQICCLIMLVTISNKLLVLPALMYENTGTDAIWVVILKLSIALATFVIFGILAVKFKDKSLEDILVPYISKFGYALLLLAFGIFYLLKTFLTLIEGEIFLKETIYVELQSELYALPTFIIAGYFIYKGINVIGRTNEVLFRVVLWGVIITILLTLPNLRPESLLPLFVADSGDFLSTFSQISLWFGNYFVIFLFLGNIKVEDKFISKIVKSFLMSAITVVIFFTVYYCVFGESSQIHNFAINDIVTLTPQLSSLIKIDWFTVIFYSFALIMQVLLQLYFVFYCVGYLFKVKTTKLSVSIFVLILALAYWFMPFSAQQVIAFCSKTAGVYCFILNMIFPILIFIVLLIDVFKQKRKKGVINYGRIMEKE